jgi:hypothetical protein
VPVTFTGPDGPKSLTPAPLVDIRKEYIRSEDGKILHPQYVITLIGTIVNIGNSLDSPGAVGASFGNMNGVLAEESRLRRLFSVDGGRLEIVAPAGGGPNDIDAYCTIESVNFDRSTWTIRCDYTIVLRATKITEDASETIQELSSFNENWSMTENQDNTYTIVHQLKAVGSLIYGASGPNDPLSAAMQWCKDRSYAVSTTGTLSTSKGILDFSKLSSKVSSDGTNYWNYAIVEGVGPYEYSWSINETFLYAPSGQTREEWNATVNYEQDNPRKITISLQGSVYGYADRISNLTLRNSRVKTYYNTNVEPNLFTRINGYSPGSFTINPVATSKQITYEEINGVLRYNVVFTAASGTLIANALEESINVVDNAPTDIFAQIPIPGRANGPVVQYMNTSSLPERTVTINLLMTNTAIPLNTGTLLSLYNTRPNTDAIITALQPSAGNYYIKQNSIEWNPIKRQYSRVVSWTIQPEGSTITGIPVNTGLNNPKV